MAHDLLLTFDFPPLGGGISRWMSEIALGYPAGELVVSTGTLPGWELSDQRFSQRIDRVKGSSHRLRSLQGMIPWASRVAKLAADPSARFAWCDSVRPAAYAARWANRRTGLPYGVIVHGGDLLRFRKKVARSRFKRASYRSLFTSASVVVANSQWTAELCHETLADFGVKRGAVDVVVVPLGTTPSLFRPNEAAANQFRKDRQLPDGRWLVTVARLVPHKGVDTSIGVLAELVGEFPDLHYAVVGQGPYEGSLRELANRTGFSDRVHFLSGLAGKELPAAFAMADIYLGLSRRVGMDVEGFGISLLEASSSGIPVVAGKSGGIPDAVADGVTGILVDPDGVEEPIAAVRQLLRDPELAKKMGAAGRERVLATHNWTRVVSDLRTLAAEYGRRG